MKNRYTTDQLKEDLEWMEGYGITRRDAIDLIAFILESDIDKDVLKLIERWRT